MKISTIFSFLTKNDSYIVSNQFILIHNINTQLKEIDSGTKLFQLKMSLHTDSGSYQDLN